MLPRLWFARVHAPMPPEAARWRDADETARLDAMLHQGERRRRAVAWSLRRWALSQCRPEELPGSWRFVAGPTGKPTLAPPFDRHALHHSISHGGDYAAVLIADDPCGVDVEPPPAGLEAASVVFDTAVQAEIAAHPRSRERFLQHWVAREAALKMRGTGFDDSAAALRLALAPDGLTAVVARQPAEPPDASLLRLWPLLEGHWLAAAWRGPPIDLQPIRATWQAE